MTETVLNLNVKELLGRTGRGAKPSSPCVMVIFGATGDLTARKLIPSLYNLKRNKLLADEFAIVGVAMDALDDDSFRKAVAKDVDSFATSTVDDDAKKWILDRTYYLPGQFNDPAVFERLKGLLDDLDAKYKTRGNAFFYLATSPRFFGEITRQLGSAGLTGEENRFRRAVYEKPFGNDLASAKALNAEIRGVLRERQIYRIDHYLGKETVQNMLVFRFGNGIFEPVWNRRFIDHVQVTVAETVGVEKRGGYFEGAGTLRDMVPNHICQLLSLTAMEPPNSFHADAVRDEQAKVLNAIQPLSGESVLHCSVRGQYGEGEIEGMGVLPYREEPGVAPDSKTETFVALKLNIDNWRWADVPFYIRTGKRMAARHTEVAIQFKQVPFVLFRETDVSRIEPNFLVIHIAPDEGISLHFNAKMPGMEMRVGGVDMDFNYADYFGSFGSTGYEVLIYDCMIGDQTLFQRADMVEAGWSVVDPVLDVWKALPPRNFPNYPAGSWGPKESEDMMARDGRRWRNSYHHPGSGHRS
jgi:glucose-6-phosphate 1-dehydrogenase